MSEGYSGDKILARQRVCGKCRSFVTMDKVNEKQFSCPLCNQRLEAFVNLQGVITAKEIQNLVTHQHRIRDLKDRRAN